MLATSLKFKYFANTAALVLIEDSSYDGRMNNVEAQAAQHHYMDFYYVPQDVFMLKFSCCV